MQPIELLERLNALPDNVHKERCMVLTYELLANELMEATDASKNRRALSSLNVPETAAGAGVPRIFPAQQSNGISEYPKDV